MADKVVLEAEIKSNIKAVSKETKELTNDFGAFGITIGGIKDKFKDMGKIMMNGFKQIHFQAKLVRVGLSKMFSGQVRSGAKTLFKVIKTGIAATGIGLLVIAFGSLIAYVTNTKKGAEALEKTLKTLGAAVSIITDRIAKFGGAVVKFFKRDFKGAAEDAKAAVSGIVKELKEEVTATLKVVDANQKLRDAQRALNVETAQSVADIEKLKLVAEDITKTYAERETAATQAFEKETELENKRIKLAEQAVALEAERHRIMGKDGVMAQDLDTLAEAEIALANVRQESAGRQISLQNFLNSLRETEKAEIQADKDKEKADEDAAWAKKMEDNKKWNEEQQKMRELNAEAAKVGLERIQDETDEELKIRIEGAKKEIAAEKAVVETKKAIRDANVSNIEAGINLVKNLAGENEAVQAASIVAENAVGIAKTIISTQASNATAIAEGAALAIPSAGASVIAASALVASNNIAAGISIAASAAATAKGLSQLGAGGGGGGGKAPSGGGGASPQIPAPQMMSGEFQLGGGIKPEPVKAFVVTDEMTSSQNQLANIRRRATI